VGKAQLRSIRDNRMNIFHIKMECELQNLRQLLKEELERQERSNDTGEGFEERIQKIERQISGLSNKLWEANKKLEKRENEKLKIHSQVSF